MNKAMDNDLRNAPFFNNKKERAEALGVLKKAKEMNRPVKILPSSVSGVIERMCKKIHEKREKINKM